MGFTICPVGKQNHQLSQRHRCDPIADLKGMSLLLDFSDGQCVLFHQS
jgi:hypothetical protein